MYQTFGQSLIKELSLTTAADHSSSNEKSGKQNLMEPRSSKWNRCRNCVAVYPKGKYKVLSKNPCQRKHNTVFLVKDRQTGSLIKVSFLNGLKDRKNVRIYKAYENSKGPCKTSDKRKVYRLLNIKTGYPVKIDFSRDKNKKKIARILLS
ncbi:uncharacterized protein Dana_GF27793 [Drosophila ananassae]|uniref:Uncharacterized protein n=1 Tax=Drosophila ananassae TaxID=7217 RepID=A0A0N8P1N5_DROAN|nr:uncharacterized protein Dana_GF27793 [Drosophila ananassae]